MESFLKRCTEPLLRVFANAAQQAVIEGKKMIEPSHLFFGLTHPDQSVQTTPTQKKRNVKKQSPTPNVTIASLSLSPLSVQLLSHAARLAESYSHDAVGPEHLFASILHNPDPSIQQLLKDHQVDSMGIKRQLVGVVHHTTKLLELLEMLEHNTQHALPDGQHNQQHTHTAHQSALEFFTTELTNEKIVQTFDPLIGREQEFDRIIRILARRTKNNPVLVGPPGVGKTALVQGLAQRIFNQSVPEYLKSARIFRLNMSTLLAGTGMRGELELRLSALINDIQKAPNAILFIDELHTLMGTGGMHGPIDASEAIKPELSRGTLRCIGATTPEAYKRWIEDDPAFERRFQKITIEQPSTEETKKILQGLLKKYEAFHQVQVSSAALDACVHLADRYITEKYFPDKALDIIDEASAHIKITESSDRTITPDLISTIISSLTGIPPVLLAHENASHILDLESRLRNTIVGQDTAVHTIAKAIIRAASGLTGKGRPRASFLFLGPSGVGKTECARTVARELFGENALLKFDMSEFSESHTIARLIGSPSGYIGYKEGGRLTEGVRRKPHSVILFDEAEKAHPRVLNILLQILDDGRLTDMAGREVDFSNTIIILTSNIGSQHWNSSGGTLGFESTNIDTIVKRERMIMDLKQWLTPELLNRIDHITTFNPLSSEHLRKIAEVHLNALVARCHDLNVTLKWKKTVLDHIMERAKTDEHGARSIRHMIEETIEGLVAEQILHRDSTVPIALTLSRRNNDLRIISS